MNVLCRVLSEQDIAADVRNEGTWHQFFSSGMAVEKP
jgi:hypothetical protein